MLALVHLINCKLFQSFYKHEIIPCNSFHIPSVLKSYGRVCRETNRKCTLLLSENLESLHSCIYTSVHSLHWCAKEKHTRVLITLCILVLSFEFDFVWSTRYFPGVSCPQVLPCLALPCPTLMSH